MSTVINKKTQTQRDEYFVSIAKETQTGDSLKRKFRYNAAFRLPAIRKERLTLTLPALAVYCTYKRKIPTRSSVMQKREPYRNVI